MTPRPPPRSGRPRAVTYAGVEYDLQPTFPRALRAVTQGRPDGVTVVCAMSCHCFTQNAAVDTSGAFDYRHEAELRVFCPERFALSRSIYAHFDYALGNAAGFRTIWSRDKTGSVNNLTVDDLRDGNRYCMFFDLSLQRRDRSDYILLQIRSAYRQQISLRGRQFVKLGTLIDQKLGLRPPPNRKGR